MYPAPGLCAARRLPVLKEFSGTTADTEGDSWRRVSAVPLFRQTGGITGAAAVSGYQ